MADFGRPVIDHVNIGVSDIERSTHFYAAALAPLGLRMIFEFPAEQTASRERIRGFGLEQDRPVFWLIDRQRPGSDIHLAFQASTRAEVDAFHAAALRAGGRDNGTAGLRPYHPNYYGAFVHDPDGFNIEAVCHGAE